jgi:murein DD-endopeptidase MepM/ murein hydrolase activator NlpD
VSLRAGVIACLIIGCLWLFLSWPSFATDGYCREDWACVEISNEKTTPTFVLKNQKPYPVTITVIAYTKNLMSSVAYSDKYTETRVVDGNSQVEVLALRPKHPDRKIRYSYDMRWSPGDMHAQHTDSYQYALPLNKDKRYRLVQGFNGGYSHYGPSKYAVDFAMPVGSPVHAARDGVVIDVVEKHNKGGANRRYAKYANFIVVLHSDRTTGEYYHLKQNGVLVEVGQTVKEGDLIGYSGNTGFSSLPHLHFAVYRAKSHGKYESLPFTFKDNAKTTRRYYGNKKN